MAGISEAHSCSRSFAGQLYHKPSISVFPHPEVIQGGNVRISCGNALYSHATFHLFKGLISQPVKVQQPSSFQSYSVVFNISNVQQSDGGSYSCVYCISEDLNRRCSLASDTVSIVVAAEVYPKPSISVSPGELLSRGENASIRCKSSQQANGEFILRQTVFSRTYRTKKTASDEVVFPIGQAKSSHAGMYQCRYCFHSDSAFYKRCSGYSDKAYINITGECLPSPSGQQV
ncbi:leukocyte immunoglobulin-like receptor subfamily A member 2 [Varanus komodoensis]|uniref:leukocyte immunoglobulin-like receptor subfamily A member 2 n=1 Tax=Varanus komodoensis TaxID=61221 RepID=UPI001CF7B956|nr:leukocyte immunoglobulin-like receptor subfamily A member 2 [Varanus komodoensis]